MIPFSPPVPPKDTPRWLYEILRRLGYSAGQHDQAIAAIGRGEAPDGSGNPLTDLSLYFYLPGRNGGQIAHGGTGVSETMTLSSTKSSTKSFIYLGTAHTSAYDELNDRVGIGTPTPQAKLHIKVGTAGPPI